MGDRQESGNEIRCDEISFYLFDGFRIAARAWGSPDAPLKVLCCHGYMDNSASFTPLARELIGKHGNEAMRMVCFDFSGHGQSEHLPIHGYNGIWVDEVIKIADALRWEKFVLLGHSMGQAISVIVAGTIPERIERLILIEGVGPMSIREEDAPFAVQQRLKRTLRSLPRSAKVYASKEECIDRMMLSNAKLKRESVELLVERGITYVDEGVRFAHDPKLRGASAFFFLTEKQVRSFLSRIQCPALVIWGTHRWYPIDKKLNEERTNAMPNSKTVVIEGNHHVHLERAGPTAAHLSAFLFGDSPRSKL